MTSRAEGAVSGEREMDELLKQCRDALIEAKYFFDEDFPDGSGGPCAVTGRYRAAFKSIEALLPKLDAALAQPQLRDAPEGWQLVPVEPPSEMAQAWETAYRDAPEGSGVAGAWDAAYTAMLAAAPSPSEPKLCDAPDGWKTIESAPEGGIPFDAWAISGPGDNGFRVANCWTDETGVRVPAGVMFNPFCTITHWRPIPPSPSEPKEDKSR